MALEARLVSNSGPTEELAVHTNNSGVSMSITNHEVFAKAGNSGHRIVGILWAASYVATPGTLADGETGMYAIAGRFSFPKDTAVALAQGGTAWWDYSANKATNHATANDNLDFSLGRIVESAALADTHVTVDINEGPQAGSMGSSSSSSLSSSSSSSSSTSVSSSSSSSSST